MIMTMKPMNALDAVTMNRDAVNRGRNAVARLGMQMGTWAKLAWGVAAALLGFGMLFVTPGAARGDTLDEMSRKLAGAGQVAPGIEPLALGAHALVSRDHTIALSAYGGALKVEGSTFDAHQTTLAFVNPTADRTVTFPDGTGTVALQSTATLAAGSAPSFAPGAGVSVYKLTPAQDETIAAVTAGAVSGKSYCLVVTTSGTSSFTLTFGTNFKTTGTLATGTASGKVFVIQFIFDGVKFIEVARTAAM